MHLYSVNSSSEDLQMIASSLVSKGNDRDSNPQHIMHFFFLQIVDIYGSSAEHLTGRQLPQCLRGNPPSLVFQLIVGDSPIIQQVMAEQTSANVFLLRKWDFRTDMTKWLTARLERRQMEDRSRAGCKQTLWEEKG